MIRLPELHALLSSATAYGTSLRSRVSNDCCRWRRIRRGAGERA